jgi:hypothetical protein
MVSESQSEQDPQTTSAEPTPEDATAVAVPVSRHPLLRYTAYRVLVFVIALGVLYVLGARSFLLAALAVVVSGLVSLVVLDRQRDGAALTVGKALGRVNDRIEAGKRKEDEDTDEAERPSDDHERPTT